LLRTLAVSASANVARRLATSSLASTGRLKRRGIDVAKWRLGVADENALTSEMEVVDEAGCLVALVFDEDFGSAIAAVPEMEQLLRFMAAADPRKETYCEVRTEAFRNHVRALKILERIDAEMGGGK
jgi:hypothetical protein